MNTQSPQKLPQNLSAERSAVSILSQIEECMTAYSWTEDLFIDFAPKTIFQTIVGLRKTGSDVNISTISAILEGSGLLEKIGGQHALDGILNDYPLLPGASSSHADIFHRELVDAASRRNVLVKASEMTEDLRAGDITAEEFIAEVSASAIIAESRKRQTLKEQIAELIDEIENSKPPECFKFGIPSLDYLLYGGFQRGELTTVAGPTSGGKSLLLAQAALESARSGKSVAFYSLEMPAKAVLRRIVSNAANFCLPKPNQQLTKEQWSKVSVAFAEVQKLPITIADGITNIADIEADCARLVKLGKADLVVVDYIQRVRNPLKNANREQVIADISSRLKTLAMSTGSTVLTASQLNKDGDVRESAAIQQDSDTLIKISDDSDKLTLDKFRRGESNKFVWVEMEGHLGRFKDNPQKKDRA